MPGAIRTLIIGGGTAGAVLAARLSESADRHVTLIEAGPAGDTPAELLDGSVLPAVVPGHPANWGYESELMPGVRTIVPRGRVLGGSSTINGGYCVRARAGDFERWARAGGAAWSYVNVLPLLTELETDLDFGAATDAPVPAPAAAATPACTAASTADSAGAPATSNTAGARPGGHGGHGPIVVQRPPQDGELAAAFTAAALELGFPAEPDKNARAGTPGSGPGVGPVPSNIVDGVRVNTALAYLTPARGRANLTVLGNTRAVRVLIEDGRAVGALVCSDTAVSAAPSAAGAAASTRHDAATHPSPGRNDATETGARVTRIDADEVILCAGAVGSAHLLLLSGIGPRADLEALGIDVAADLPVGQSFHDHPNLALFWRPARPIAGPRPQAAFPTALNFSSTGAATAAASPHSTSTGDADADGGSARDGSGEGEGDLEILLTVQPEAALFAAPEQVPAPPPPAEPSRPSTPQQPPAHALNVAPLGEPDRAPADPPRITKESVLRLIIALQQPLSRGRLSLRSTDPNDPPRIEYHYLEHEADRARFRIAVRTAAALLSSHAFDGFFGGFTSLDTPTLHDDARLDAWIRTNLGTAIHLSATAPMGDVVDGAGRVHGVAGLRVADTSIVPSAPSRGPFHTAVLIGELIARQMRENT